MTSRRGRKALVELYLVPNIEFNSICYTTARMLTRRLITSSSLTSNLSRAFSTTPRVLRTPSLADIRHDHAVDFDRRQHEFREATKAARKAKAEQDSQFVKQASNTPAPSSAFRKDPDTPTAPPASDASPSTRGVVSNIANKFSLGSLSTASTEAAREESSAAESSKRKGALASLIYGTKEGQQMDQEIERSFSQVLARGKYVHSIVFHTVKPDKVDDYIKLVGEWYPKVAGTEDFHVHLVGSWRTEVGDCDTFGISIRSITSSLY